MDMVVAFLAGSFLATPVWMWLTFITVVVVLLVFDLGIFHREHRDIGVTESLVLSTVYISFGLLFGGWVWYQLGSDAGMNYLTGFAVEKALAMDNVFVIAMIFGFFAVPSKYQHRVLFWGILGVIVLRAIMIALGATLVSEFGWILYVFAAFLVATGVKMLLWQDGEYDVAKNPLLGFVRRHFYVTETHYKQNFFVKLPHPRHKEKLVWHMTPLFLALVMVEVADIIFAVDSVPAIFAITTDPYIVYTSNIFAILGLRALYFALAAMIHRFMYLKQALALVLPSRRRLSLCRPQPQSRLSSGPGSTLPISNRSSSPSTPPPSSAAITPSSPSTSWATRLGYPRSGLCATSTVPF